MAKERELITLSATEGTKDKLDELYLKSQLALLRKKTQLTKNEFHRYLLHKAFEAIDNAELLEFVKQLKVKDGK